MKSNYNYDEDGFKRYLKDIDKYKPLTMAKERELGERIKRGDREALNALVNHNLKFVVSTAKKYGNFGYPMMDLVCEGNIGLMHAAEKFDGTRNLKFITYAVWWVKYYISEYIKNKNNKQEQSLENYAVEPKPCDDYCELVGASEDFEEKLATTSSQSVAVDELLKCLKDRELKVLRMFYGLTDGREMTLEEVGNEMNLTMERVRQIKDSALTKLRSNALAMPSTDFRSFRELV